SDSHGGPAFAHFCVILVHRRDPASPFRQAGWRPAWWVTIALVAALSVSVFVLARDESKESKRMVRNFYGVLRESDEVAPNVVLLKGDSQAERDDLRLRRLTKGTT